MLALPKIFFTDFDGTIKPPLGPVAETDLAALKELGRLKVLRVVATGRSLFAFQRDWDRQMEIDYLIFSSGLGVCPWGPQGPGKLLFSRSFTDSQTQAALKASLLLGRGFFAFQPPPECHRYIYLDPDRFAPTEGYLKRMEIYREVAEPYKGQDLGRRGQFLITAPASEMPEVRAQFEKLAPGLSLMYSSSPFGDRALWLEIFPPDVSKGATAQWLAKLLNIDRKDCLAMGNDYNDLDLLAWAGKAFLTADASKALRHLYPLAPASTAAPVAWLADRLQRS
ncbi:MAG: Cof-type HAD-IIB family hydrolase [Deltaproteobacteria bacterium]|jgi:hydroxymethylpyrimidine pyrophosphatase-like HAD family hydrolase|nr:Cof-type HAD-IIB family hydrolase [Deltaproteobacteria bacterium]